MNISVMPPDLNQGQVGFNVVGNKILFGLAAIKGIGEKAVEKVIEARETRGEFKSLLDFVKRAENGIANRRAIENFVKAGAFDWTGVSRAEMIESVEEVMKIAQRCKDQENSNQMGLFANTNELNDEDMLLRKKVPEWPQSIRLAHEKDALGFYLSGHPLEKFKDDLKRLGSLTIEGVQSYGDGAVVTISGVISFLRLKNTKKGDRYATFVLEDLGGTIEVIVWPDTYLKVQSTLVAEDPVLVTGKLDVSDERRILVATNIESAIALRDRTAKEAVLVVHSENCSTAQLARLRELFVSHPGNCPVKLVFRKLAHSETMVSLPKEIKVEPSEKLCNLVEQLFGEPVMSFR
jgi:DNA polymerase III subunit alpha